VLSVIKPSDQKKEKGKSIDCFEFLDIGKRKDHIDTKQSFVNAFTTFEQF
jgi:hypothetical protein